MIKIRSKRGRTSSQLSLVSCNPDMESSPIMTSAVNVATNEDLLVQILFHVPLKPLTTFKSVSKHWFSLITNPQFVRHFRNTLYPSASSLFFRRPGSWRSISTSEYQFIPLVAGGECTAPFKTLDFIPDPCTELEETYKYLLQSCNGLLLCSVQAPEKEEVYFVCNPTTKELATLSQIRLKRLEYVLSMNLVFDPANSPHYKVVCVRGTVMSRPNIHIAIYSSQTRLWTESVQIFIPPQHSIFSECVYWNGSLHWWDSHYDESVWASEPYVLYFKVDEERAEKLLLPKNHVGMPYMQKQQDGCFIDGCSDYSYFGESADSLHYVSANSDFLLSVYEMERDYSGWFVKYQVDVSAVTKVFPEVKGKNLLYGYTLKIISLINQERKIEGEDGSFLVLEIPGGKIIRYNLVDKSVTKLWEIDPGNMFYNDECIRHVRALPYVVSLACV